MDQDGVRNRMEQFVALMREEQELRDQLLALDFTAVSPDVFAKNLAKQQELIGGIDTIYQEKMLPIMRELAEFVGANLPSE